LGGTAGGIGIPDLVAFVTFLVAFIVLSKRK